MTSRNPNDGPWPDSQPSFMKIRQDDPHERPTFEAGDRGCCDCESTDTVSLTTGDDSATIIWCHCGAVYVEVEGHPHKVWDFCSSS